MAFLQKSLMTAGAIAFSMSLAQNVSANSTTYQVKRGDTVSNVLNVLRLTNCVC